MQLTPSPPPLLRAILNRRISRVRQGSITDKAFEKRNAHSKHGGCSQATITDKVNLRGIHTLNMWGCSQSIITDKAFENLHGIHALNMSYCEQATITDKAYLDGIRLRNIGYVRDFLSEDARIALSKMEQRPGSREVHT